MHPVAQEKNMPRPGVKNVTLYFPKGMEWIEDVIQQVIDRAAKQGISISISDVVISALSEAFADSPFREQTREVPIAKKPGVESVKVRFSGENKWLYLMIEQLVQTKRLVGAKTSMAREILRLASNALKGEAIGAELDIQIFKEFYEEQLKDFKPARGKKWKSQ
jgi:hypothetical protein